MGKAGPILRKAMVNGMEGLLSDDRTLTVPKYPFRYDMRHMDLSPDKPATIENFVAVNYFGSILLKERLEVPRW